MRNLSLAIAPLLVTACMSDGARLRGTEGGRAGRSESASQVKDAADPQATQAPLEEPIIADPVVASEPNAESTEAAQPPVPVENPAPVVEAPAVEPEPAPAPVSELPTAAECISIKPGIQLPHFLPDQSALVVKFQKPCQNAEGVSGFLPKSKWTAVGVSCTGGLGRIDKKAHELSNPDLIIFKMELNCPMTPTEAVDAMGRKTIGVPPDSRLAFIPMSIEYWEFEGLKEAGLWTSPTLTKGSGGTELWKKYTAQKLTSFPIRLYGRESAFGNDTSVFEAEAVIKPKGSSQFGVQVKSIKQLSPEERATVLKSCQLKLRASDQCLEVFGGI